MTLGVSVALIAYALLGLVVAFAARRGLGAGAGEYFLAGRRAGGVLSALSYGATTYSAFMMVGLAGLTYAGGVGALGFELVYLAGLGLVAIFGPRFWLAGQRFGYITPAEMLSHRYDNALVGGVMAVAACVFLIPYSAVQLMGIGYLLSGVSDGAISFEAGILVGTALALIWTLAAGLRSVLWTDALQVVVMLVTSLVAVGFVVAALGGPGAFMASTAENRGEWLAVPGPGLFGFMTFVGLTLPWFFFSISNPQVSQRLFTTESIGAMRVMLLGFLVLGFVYTLVSVIWGFSALQLLPALERADLATPQLLSSGAIPTLVSIILVVGIVAAAVSTVDSILLSLASLAARDLYRPLAPTGAREMLAGKVVMLLVAVLAVLFARLQLDLITILSVASSAGLLVTVPAIVGAFFWRGGSAPGALVSMVVAGIAVTVLQVTGTDPLGVPASIWGGLTAVILFVVVSWLTTAPRARAEEFLAPVEAGLIKHRIR
ncbi:pantothenate permease [Spiribacter salinus M19-40]|jgi:SSS family solute:Na+ symporter|uniref:Pantothenate permease n=2 Tax=Spiribacter salinus TaxID=1335746 RepID=R4VGK5_9GAMM|nr:sodium:solute symporter family protein [Spiribacter salinus]AGM41346.1 pantothenate permease [Spiribacter salinus M19-40]MBY5268936.1 pantothenate permease [Spiribacter salinus]TQF00701.1 MAG: sodium:solute symporter family protein [Spiribacter salinus]